MPLDVFMLKDHVVDEYRSYLESLVNIQDARLDGFVREELSRGALWPEAYLQLNPAFEGVETLGALADQGVIHPETAGSSARTSASAGISSKP